MKQQPVADDVFFSRQDPEDPRLGEFSRPDSPAATAVLWGYADDEGIRLNGGRPGALEAPAAIRRALYRMTPARSWPRNVLIEDRGDFLPETESLTERLKLAKDMVLRQHLDRGSFLITLGGGHDYGYPDAAGFVEAYADGPEKPLVLNFDAHLDVRPLDRGPTSGTPFRWLLEQHAGKFDFYEIGIQPHCNSPFHWEWAESQGAVILSQESINTKGLKSLAEESIDGALSVSAGASGENASKKRRPLFISFDIDCISAAEAPGCSAPNPHGLKSADLMTLWPWLFQNFDVKGLGLYEISPVLDHDARTSRLAAFLIHASLHELFRQEPSR